MHYQIYLPGKRTGDGLHLEAAGLGHLRGTEEYFPIHSGPDGKGGMIVAFRNGDPGGRVGFEPDEQEWMEHESSVESPESRAESSQSSTPDPQPATLDPYWVGFWKDSAPTPQELQKPPGVEGLSVTLGDGRDWIVPVAELFPQDVIFEKGSSCSVVKKQFAKFWEESIDWAHIIFDPNNETEIDDQVVDDLFAFVMRVIGINYRIVPEVVTYLRLFDISTLMKCVEVVLNKEMIDVVEEGKKTANLADIPAG